MKYAVATFRYKTHVRLTGAGDVATSDRDVALWDTVEEAVSQIERLIGHRRKDSLSRGALWVEEVNDDGARWRKDGLEEMTT